MLTSNDGDGMSEKNTNFFEDFLPQLKDFVKAETVFGEPYQVGDVTLIPVNSVKVGFAVGGGKVEKKDNQGGGGGVLLTPVAFLVVKEGNVTIQNLNSGTVENVMQKVPDVLERFLKIIGREPAPPPPPMNDAQ